MGSKHSGGSGGGLTEASAGGDGMVPSSSGFLLRGGLFLAAGEAGGVSALLRTTSALDAIGFAARSGSCAAGGSRLPCARCRKFRKLSQQQGLGTRFFSRWSAAPARCPGCAAVSFSQPAEPKAQHEAAGTWLPLGHTTVSSPFLARPSRRAG